MTPRTHPDTGRAVKWMGRAGPKGCQAPSIHIRPGVFHYFDRKVVALGLGVSHFFKILKSYSSSFLVSGRFLGACDLLLHLQRSEAVRWTGEKKQSYCCEKNTARDTRCTPCSWKLFFCVVACLCCLKWGGFVYPFFLCFYFASHLDKHSFPLFSHLLAEVTTKHPKTGRQGFLMIQPPSFSRICLSLEKY